MHVQTIGLLCLIIVVNYVTATNPTIPPNVCESKVCKKESANLLNYMDESLDPCNNFYDFVCGKYLRETVLPVQKSVDFSLLNLEAKLRRQVGYILLLGGADPNELPTLKLAKDFMDICSDANTLNAAGIQPMLEYFDKYGGFPVIKGESGWNEDGWDVLNVVKQVTRDGFYDQLLHFSIRSDEKDNSKYAVFIDSPFFSLSTKFLQQGSNNSRVKQYYNFMVDVAVIYGAKRSDAEREMRDALEFEMKLANNALSDEHRRDMSVTANYYNLTSLQAEFPLLNWRDFLDWNLKSTTTLTGNDMITVPDVKYLRELKKILESTPKRTIANYIGIRLAVFSSDLLNDTLLQRKQQYENEASGTRTSTPRIIECVKKTTKSLPILTAAIYIRNYFDKESKGAADKMANNIKTEFIEMLKKAPWMDDTTRDKAIEKANAMILIMGYPDELADDAKLEEYYRDLKLQPNSYLQSVLNIQKFARDRKIHDFRNPILRNDWRSIAPQVTEVDAFN